MSAMQLSSHVLEGRENTLFMALSLIFGLPLLRLAATVHRTVTDSCGKLKRNLDDPSIVPSITCEDSISFSPVKMDRHKLKISQFHGRISLL